MHDMEWKVSKDGRMEKLCVSNKNHFLQKPRPKNSKSHKKIFQGKYHSKFDQPIFWKTVLNFKIQKN